MSGAAGPFRRVAVVGAGQMGEAFIRGLLQAGMANPEEVVASDVSEARLAHVGEAYGVRVTASNPEAVRQADVVLLAVKPQQLPEVLVDLAPAVEPQRHLVVSIAAGVPTAELERRLPAGTPVVRAMPNLAAVVGQAATGICRGRHAGQEHRAAALRLFEAVGRAVEVPEALMDAVTGLSGSGPAYVFLVAEALTEGGVAAGLSRETALLLAAQTLSGAARMLLETGRHPAELRSAVTSPGGTTAAGLLALEARAVRAAFIEAALAATRRSAELAGPAGH